MGLNKVKIGTFVELYSEACNIPNLTVNDVSGVNRDKEFFEPSKQVGSDTSKYKVVPPNYFACNLMHVGRDVVLPIAINHTDRVKYVSPAYTVFKIIDEQVILKDYFYVLLKSDERDRYFWFNTDSSVRDGMEWKVFCDVEIEIPEVSVQEKYVNIYLGLQENLNAMTRGVDQMHRACDVYMENLLKTVQLRPIGNYVAQLDIRNQELKYDIDNVRGISTQKEFITTKANMNGVSLHNYKVVEPGFFAYVADTSRRGDKISLAYNDSNDTYLVSSITTMFRVVQEQKETLLAEYLFLFLRRPEFDRYARYNSWGSARETIAWEDLCRLEIPIPPTDIQQDIVNIFNAYNVRRQLVDKLTDLQKKICPILIKGAIEEGGR